MTKVSLPDLASMQAFGDRIAAALRPGDVIALTGGLGAGKSTLARAILSAMGHDGEVPSPTFTIIEVYDGNSIKFPVVHADFYRLESPGEVVELGLDDYRDGAALIAEWPENAGGFTDEAGCLSIALEVVPKGRMAVVEYGKDWQERSV